MARKPGIPRHRAYASGIASAAYDLEHLLLAFGMNNCIHMLEQIERGNTEAVRKMLRNWTLHQYGPEYSMIDEACNTQTAYGLTARTAAANGASSKREI